MRTSGAVSVPRAAALAALLAALLSVAGCTTNTTSHPVTEPASLSLANSPAGQAIQATIDEINATAGGTVTAQRAVLDRLAAPDETTDQRACPTATTTLGFDPAFSDLRPAPDASSGEYLLPTYITIYTDGRITGSDLTTLRLWVTGGSARTSALCVS